MKPPNANITAGEFLAQLAKDPSHVAEKHRKDFEWAEKGWRLQELQRPLLEDLAQVGIKAKSIWDLVSRSTPYREGLPVLVAHLHRQYPSRVLEGIARSLGVTDALPYWEELKALSLEAPSGPNDLDDDLPRGSLKEGLAVALSAMADDSKFNEIVEILHNKQFGPGRAAFVMNLAKSKRPEAWPILDELASDPDLEPEISEYRKKKLRNEKRRKSRSTG